MPAASSQLKEQVISVSSCSVHHRGPLQWMDMNIPLIRKSKPAGRKEYLFYQFLPWPSWSKPFALTSYPQSNFLIVILFPSKCSLRERGTNQKNLSIFICKMCIVFINEHIGIQLQTPKEKLNMLIAKYLIFLAGFLLRPSLCVLFFSSFWWFLPSLTQLLLVPSVHSFSALPWCGIITRFSNTILASVGGKKEKDLLMCTIFCNI